MNLKHLRAALAIRKSGSVTKASADVYMSQSALSQALKSLEQDLGCTLFNTSASGTSITEGGEVFLHRAERALRHLKDLEDLVSRSTGERSAIKNRLTKRHLDALTEVVEHQSYSAAALQLGITQPSVHKAIRTLEDLCGVRLFTRRPNGVDPTWLAKQLALHASLSVAELSQGRDELAEQAGFSEGNSGLVRSLLPKPLLSHERCLPSCRSFPIAVFR